MARAGRPVAQRRAPVEAGVEVGPDLVRGDPHDDQAVVDDVVDDVVADVRDLLGPAGDLPGAAPDVGDLPGVPLLAEVAVDGDGVVAEVGIGLLEPRGRRGDAVRAEDLLHRLARDCAGGRSATAAPPRPRPCTLLLAGPPHGRPHSSQSSGDALRPQPSVPLSGTDPGQPARPMRTVPGNGRVEPRTSRLPRVDRRGGHRVGRILSGVRDTGGPGLGCGARV